MTDAEIWADAADGLGEAIVVRRLADVPREDFFRLHCEENGLGWCHCVAWHVDSFDGWSERTAEENRALREELLDDGHADGYLLYVGEEPVGWCQVGPRDRLPNLRATFDRPPDPDVWAVTCFAVAPGHRGEGHARRLLGAVLDDLRGGGVERVEAYPVRAEDGGRLPDGEVWTGPASLFRRAGFEEVDGNDRRAVVSLDL